MRFPSPLVSIAVAFALGSSASPADAADPVTASIPVPVLAAAPAQHGVIDDSWAPASHLALTMDFTNRRTASEPTAVSVAQDGSALDVAFAVTQREGFVESNETNGSSVTSDDYVAVLLSPNGPLGFQYAFYVNPRGARYQTSSENSSYTPPWASVAKRTASGYSVTLRIPLNIIRSGGRTTWRAQFVRATVHANALDVWTYSERATSVSDATYFGTLTGIGMKAASTRPRARAQIYGLAEKTTSAYGGDTSRIGGDLALPITPTASFVASFHPDNSNVETDQQTIAPTAFAHQYTEVRPFFTQAGSSFNYSSGNINSPTLLYTPAIPTYRDAYAVEGTQGPLTFAAFDAVGVDRTDAAEALDYNVSTPVHSYGVNVQNIGVNAAAGVHDQLTSLTADYVDTASHALVVLNSAQETGASVSAEHDATYLQTGAGYSTATTTALLLYEDIGPQFAPVDSYVPQNDISGPQAYLGQTWQFKPKTILHDISLSSYAALFHDQAGSPSQNDADLQVNFDFANLMTVHTYYTEEAVRTYANEFLPFDGSGFLIGYKYATSTPTYIDYQGGPYYHGTLDAWTYLTTLKLAPRIHMTLETDEDQYFSTYPGELRTNEWLERASLDFQINREMQFDLGARKIVGSNVPMYSAAPDFTPATGGNISAAFHFLSRDGKSEFYAVYGDPNSFSTTPALFLKYIRYIGASKGT